MAASLATNPGVRSAIGLLEAWLDSQLAYRGWPGLSIGILHDQELIWSRAFGHASLERYGMSHALAYHRVGRDAVEPTGPAGGDRGGLCHVRD